MDLGTPAQLWRRWLLLAAGHAAAGSDGVEIRADGSGRLRTQDGAGWLRMRRLAGNRAVLWAHHPCLAAGSGFREEMVDRAPDWSYDLDSAYAAQHVGFLAWYAHGSWNSVPQPAPAAALGLLEPVASDEAVSAWWRSTWPAAEPDDLAAALVDPDRSTLAAVMGTRAAARAVRTLGLGEVWATRRLSDTATAHLRSQIHAQMHAAAELGGRDEVARPNLLRQWSRVNVARFRHTVCAVGSATGFVHGADDVGLDDAQARSLDNVLLELRLAETDQKAGAWLFARVVGDGRSVTLERAYDGWPAWYRSSTGPSMSALVTEMDQRAPLWQPDWARLLPADRYPEGR
ncbi:hypothetical protein [Nocardioides mangrovicus]|uniref:hypothetical protein n=1 Tax=Nocardioides mangrovicus TaxID=2478913 RepID=UPI0011C441A9|nr:hypothetical protein [Nocardioides mangrovicus]